MKRILYICISVLMICSGYLFYYYHAVADSRNWEDWGSDENAKIFTIRAGRIIDEKKAIESIKKDAQQYKVNLIKKDYKSEQGETVLVKGIYAVDANFKLLMSDKSSFVLNKLSEGQMLSTKKGNPRVFDEFNDDNVQFVNIETLWKEEGIAGEYIVKGENGQATAQFAQAICKDLGMDAKELINKYSFSVYETGNAIIACWTVFGAVILFFALVNLFYTIHSSKKIGIQMLNGYSNGTIWWELVKDCLEFAVIIALVINLIVTIAVKSYTLEFMLGLMKVQILIILIIFGVSSVSYLYIHRQKAGELIKGKKRLKMVSILVKLIQLSFLSIGVVIILGSATLLTKSMKTVKELKKWDRYKDLQIISGVSTGDDMDSIAGQANTLDIDFAKFYDSMNKLGAMYFLKDTLDTESMKTKFIKSNNTYTYEDYVPEELRKEPMCIDVVMVNLNYLTKYPVYDSDGKQLSFDNKTDSPIILVPEGSDYKKDILKKLVQCNSISEQQFVKTQYGEGDKTHINMNDVQIYYYKSKENIDDITPQNNDEMKRIDDAVFCVLTKGNMSVWRKSNIKSIGLGSALKLPSSIDKATINKALKSCNLEDNMVHFSTIKNYFVDQRHALESEVKLLLAICVTIFVITLFISSQEAAINFETRKKKLAVMMTNGYSFWEKHKIRIIVDILTIVGSLIVGNSIEKVEWTLVTLVMTVLFIFLNVVIQIRIIRRDEKKVINSVLKGA